VCGLSDGYADAICATLDHAKLTIGLSWRNRTNPSTPLDVWVVEAGGTTRYVQQPSAGTVTNLAVDVKGDETFTEQVGRPGHTATIVESAHWTPGGCIFAAQAVVQ